MRSSIAIAAAAFFSSASVALAGVPGPVRVSPDGRHFVVVGAEPTRSDRRVEIAHESLIRQWPRLRAWVDEERDARDHHQGQNAEQDLDPSPAQRANERFPVGELHRA